MLYLMIEVAVDVDFDADTKIDVVDSVLDKALLDDTVDEHERSSLELSSLLWLACD